MDKCVQKYVRHGVCMVKINMMKLEPTHAIVETQKDREFNHKDYARNDSQRRRERQRRMVHRLGNGFCAICGLYADYHTNYHCDHVVPLQFGGKNNVENMQILCIQCHKEKTSREINGSANGSYLRFLARNENDFN